MLPKRWIRVPSISRITSLQSVTQRHIWAQSNSVNINNANDSSATKVPQSKMEAFTNRYLSLVTSNETSKYARLSICKDEILDGFHEVRSAEVLQSVLLTTSNSIQFAMRLREDLMNLKLQSKDVDVSLSDIRTLDGVLSRFLSNVFCRNLLAHQRITFENSSGLVLEKLAEAEAVHKIRALSEMKKRLSSKGRRCFALFHPCLDNEPLTFVHISLTSEITTSMRDIYQNEELEHPSCAIYYSINSPHPSLGGLNIAESLLKRTTTELSRLHPTIKTHSTLSPIPGFMKWLGELQSIPSAAPLACGSSPLVNIPPDCMSAIREALQVRMRNDDLSGESNSEVISLLRSTLRMEGWHTDDQFCEAIKTPLLWLCHYYLLEAKAPTRSTHMIPLDPVARFHLRNGAILHQVNWLANTDPVGIKSSAGIMVNYRYDLKRVEDLKQSYQDTLGKIPKGERVDNFLACSGT